MRMLTGMGVGFFLGLLAHHFVEGSTLTGWMEQLTKPVGSLFLRLIFMMVLPLLFSAIVVGVMECGSGAALSKLGFRTLLTVTLLSTISVVVGIGLVNLVKPGRYAPHLSSEASVAPVPVPSRSIGETLLDLVPINPLEEAVHAFDPAHKGGGILAFMTFSLIFGAALLTIPSEKSQPLQSVIHSLFEVSLKAIDFAMKLAPFAVGCFLFNLAATFGFGILKTIGVYVAVVLAALLLHGVVVYGLTLRIFAGRSPWEFLKGASEALIAGFSTASSNAALPISLRVAEENLKIPTAAARFVLTVGASANQNGTALFEGVTVLFLAQVYGVDLSLAQQIQVAFACILAGIGTAGVPGGSLPFIAALLGSLGIPPTSLGLILGVDRLLDMCRTTVNIGGDLVCAAVVGRGDSSKSADKGLSSNG